MTDEPKPDRMLAQIERDIENVEIQLEMARSSGMWLLAMQMDLVLAFGRFSRWLIRKLGDA